MIRGLFLSIVAAATIVPVTTWAQTRQHGPHVHGHGTVNLVIEGNKLAIELEAPGADIVGFEHPARTAEQTAAVDAAQARLDKLVQSTDAGDLAASQAAVASANASLTIMSSPAPVFRAISVRA